MRDFLYIWHEPESNRIITYGIEFKDMIPFIQSRGGIVLPYGRYDRRCYYEEPEIASGLSCISADKIEDILEDIKEWEDIFRGNFEWVDFDACCGADNISDQEIAELFYLSHAWKPLNGPSFPSLQNKLICLAHDNGSGMLLYYSVWSTIKEIILPMLNTLRQDLDCEDLLAEIKDSEFSFMINNDSVLNYEKTSNFDDVFFGEIEPKLRR